MHLIRKRTYQFTNKSLSTLPYSTSCPISGDTEGSIGNDETKKVNTILIVIDKTQ